MKFIKHILLGIGLILSPVTFAGGVSPIDVVKIISFECPHCAASNSFDNTLRREIKPYKGRLVIAPVSPQVETNAKDRVFYSVKKINEDASFVVKDQIFRAYHEFDLKFEDTFQVEEWVKQELQNTTFNNLDWETISKLYFSDDVTTAMIKAYQLIVKNDLENLPVYVYLKDGKVIKVVDYSDDKGIRGLKEDVFNEYAKLVKLYNIPKID